MQRSNRKKWSNRVFYSVMGVFIAGIIAFIGVWLHEGLNSLPVLGQTSNFTATDVTGKDVTFQNLNGKIRLVTWFYTRCPDECPLTAYRMEQLQAKLQANHLLGSQVVLMSITFDPTHDTLPVIQTWAKHFGVNSNSWYVIRANPAQTQRMMKAWGVQLKPGQSMDLYEHVLSTKLIDENGNVRANYSTANLDVNAIYGQIQNLIQHRNWM